MTEKEKKTIKFEMSRLNMFLDSARAERDKAQYDGNWNDVNYWRGRIEQTNETLDFLNSLTKWEFYQG